MRHIIEGGNFIVSLNAFVHFVIYSVQKNVGNVKEKIYGSK